MRANELFEFLSGISQLERTEIIIKTAEGELLKVTDVSISQTMPFLPYLEIEAEKLS
ncbi:hypothetical protein HXA41_14480 [Listeria monocytogenes]|uniref:hypothetical protein n=1 Tax=Listeria monocytogenes TaxID=1639 RepID=UPI0015A4E23C|nr:hypothetical protein [Listeria monocytogenes]EJB1148744.1 hypothetical protein [Listeria monocytogenes]EKL5553696.1 hypothetical protein [Listeria monocytogenes]MCP8299043.1 hypothetical protein [Listeria monocytogenes]NVS05030.1 hypothetical protein [Listeria monocytogenes]NVT52092.1 hypothetical protein [Listeria monocytogenes]